MIYKVINILQNFQLGGPLESSYLDASLVATINYGKGDFGKHRLMVVFSYMKKMNSGKIERELNINSFSVEWKEMLCFQQVFSHLRY